MISPRPSHRLRVPLMLLAILLLSVSVASAMRNTGRIKWFSAKKHFGMIAPEDGPKDVFFRWGPCGEECANDAKCSVCPAEGDRFEFDLVAGPKGVEAVNLSKI